MQTKAQEIRIKGACPNCQTEVTISCNLAAQDPKSISRLTAPVIRGEVVSLEPTRTIQEYRITTDMMTKFITATINSLENMENTKVVVGPRYCEKKHTKRNELHHSFAYLKIALSETVLQAQNNSYFNKIGRGTENPKIHKKITEYIINKYRFCPESLQKWMKSYKDMEELEDSFGMTEAFINDMLKDATPALKELSNHENWVVFSADPERIISQMLEDPTTSQPVGSFKIMDIREINKDNVEFIVYVYPETIELTENPHVRDILLGNEKSKK